LERYITELSPNDPSDNTLMIRIQGIITTLSNIQGLSPVLEDGEKEGTVSENSGAQTSDSEGSQPVDRGKRKDEGTSENNGVQTSDMTQNYSQDAAVMQQNDEIHINSDSSSDSQDEVDETTSDETSSDNVDNEIYPPALWPYTYPLGFVPMRFDPAYWGQPQDTWIPPDIDEHEGTPGNVEVNFISCLHKVCSLTLPQTSSDQLSQSSAPGISYPTDIMNVPEPHLSPSPSTSSTINITIVPPVCALLHWGFSSLIALFAIQVPPNIHRRFDRPANG
jgi:hypothetical protein